MYAVVGNAPENIVS